MSDLDDRIRGALASSGLPPADEPSVIEMVGQAFRGRNRWIAVVALLQTFVFVGLAAACAVQFFRAESTRALVGWAAGFLACFLVVALIKIWYWLEFVKNTLLREVKRAELQVALLAQRMGGDKPA